MSPKGQYQANLKQGLIQADNRQAAVVEVFEQLYQQLKSPDRKGWLFKKTQTPKGIYIFGSVGRGKTLLMDLFVSSLEATEVSNTRQHYHEFMLWLHKQLRSAEFAAKKDPIAEICQQLAKQIKVLCLDEFLVNDIADAMLLSNLLSGFEQYGIALVTTSNVEPKHLYKDGLQRAKFLPAIARIEQNMQILHLDGFEDYRQHSLSIDKTWFFPLNQQTKNQLAVLFREQTQGVVGSNQAWLVNDRKLNVIQAANNKLWCHFDSLCKEPRNADDYLTIADKIDTLFIEGIPRLSTDYNDQSRRFITLIDVLYECQVKVVAQAATDYQTLYQGKKLAFEFKRAASRLNQLTDCHLNSC